MTFDPARQRLTIVGAGPAGLTAAIAAAQHGLKATVLERVATLTPAGGGIVIHSNGLRVLERLRLLESLKPLMVPCRRLTLQLGNRHELVSDYSQLPIPNNYFAVVLRHQFQGVLLEAARDVATIHFGHRCIGVEQSSEHVQLRFDSDDTMESGVVIGADGAHSQVRTSLPLRTLEKSAGDAYLRGVSECECDNAEVREIWGADGRRFGIAPLPERRTYFYCSAPRGRWQQLRSEDLAAWIDGWRLYGPVVSNVLHHVRDWTDVNYDEPEQVRVTPWSSGRTFLIGDAAHAMTPNYGQGANAAMVDAVVLTTLLAR